MYCQIYTLLGRSFHNLGDKVMSLEYFHKGCNVMDVNLPHRPGWFVYIKLLFIVKNIKSMMGSRFQTNSRMNNYIGVHLSECLSSMFHVLYEMEEWKLAEYSAFYGMLMAIKFNGGLDVIVEAVTNVLIICKYIE